MALKLSKTEKMALRGYIEALDKAFPNTLDRVLLFGSKARGDFKEDSDVDIVVATKKKVSRSAWREMVGLTVDSIINYQADISPRIMPEKELKEWSPFIANVKRDAVLLWSRKKYKNL